MNLVKLKNGLGKRLKKAWKEVYTSIDGGHAWYLGVIIEEGGEDTLFWSFGKTYRQAKEDLELKISEAQAEEVASDE